MKKICFFTTEPQSSMGISYVTRELLKRLSPLKWDKYTISSVGLPMLPRDLGYCKAFSYTEATSIPHLVARVNPDIIVAYGPTRVIGTFAEHMPKRLIRKLNAEYIAYYTFEMTPPSIIVSKDAIKLYDKFMFPSEWCRENFNRYVPDFPNLYIVPHGVDMELFTPNIRSWDSELFYYGFVGRMWGRKQLNRYLPALNKVVYGKPGRVRGLLLSSGETMEMARANLMIKRYRLQDYLQWDYSFRNNIPVPQEQMPQYYHKMNVFVHPTGGEAWGLPMTEAQATGTPVIATDIPVCREVLGKDNAVFVPVKDIHPSWEGDLPLIDIDGLQEAMELLLTDEDLYYKLSKQGIDHAKQLTWQRAVDALEEALEDEV